MIQESSDMETISLKSAVMSDLPFLQSNSMKSDAENLTRQIAEARLWIVAAGSSQVGFVKSCVLWDTLPFLEVIVIVKSHRRHGHGSAAVRAWEHEMAAREFDLMLTSTQADESAQHFWRKLGYFDCGALTVRKKPAEIFLQRSIDPGKVPD